MAVLVEGVSVIVRHDSIEQRCQGGWQGFVSQVPNSTLCSDNELARVGFMHPDDVGAFLARLTGRGLLFLDSERKAVDMCVVDQRQGPTTACDWLKLLRIAMEGGSILCACIKDSKQGKVICPPGWSFERSLSRSFGFHPGIQLDENYEFIKREGNLDIYRDRRDGKEVYVGRPVSPEEDQSGMIK